MKKIKVDEEIFKAYEILLEIENGIFKINNEKIVKTRLNENFKGELEVLNNFDFDDFLRMLVVGAEL